MKKAITDKKTYKDDYDKRWHELHTMYATKSYTFSRALIQEELDELIKNEELEKYSLIAVKQENNYCYYTYTFKYELKEE